MRHRYVAQVRSVADADVDLAARFAARVREHGGLALAFEDARISVATFQGTPIHLHGRGIILGSLFARGRAHAIEALDPEESARIAATRGDRLIERYWGPYVAILCGTEGRRVDVVRGPLGELPCYFAEIDGATVIASDVDLLVGCGLFTPAIAWDEIARHLVMRDMRGPKTCLVGLRELPGGHLLAITASERVLEALWSPWSFAERSRQIDDADEAARRLHAVALECVAARASEYGSVVLMLSGGLDSSIVAACLARESLPFHCLTLVTRDATGDERDYARRVSESLAAALTEAYRDVSRIDIERSGARHLPRPTMRAFVQESSRLAIEAAQEAGAGAIFNGGGGDNVFCSLQSTGPVADRLLTAGPGAAFLRTARDISELAPASLWAVTSDAVRRAWFGKPAMRHVQDISFLSPRAATMVGATNLHPWLVFPPGALPGKAMHIRLMAFAQSYVEGLDPQDPLPTVSPLLAQPLVETCLAVPSWLWFEGGRNRVVARRAFAGDLPKDIVGRRSKGTPDSFVAQIFETHRAAIRRMLADGELAAHDMLDLPAVLRVLDDPRPVHGDAFRRVLQFADVEAWARAWTAYVGSRPATNTGALIVSNDTTSKQP
jgi:asparagine synthase (glutamine-hydrolysing)